MNNNLKNKDMNTKRADSLLRRLMQHSTDVQLQNSCEQLRSLINRGVYQQLSRRIVTIAVGYKDNPEAIRRDESLIQTRLSELLNEYALQRQAADGGRRTTSEPSIIISESFI